MTIVYVCSVYFCLQIGQSRFRAPELLFNPSMIGDESEGVHNVLGYSITKSDTDLRRTLYQNIVLSGGSTLFKGINCENHVITFLFI